jgi:small conductance mechanosensitive channel
MDDVQSILSNALSNVNLASITLTTVLRVLLLLLVGSIVIRILLKVLGRVLESSKSLAPLKVYIKSASKAILWFILVLILADTLGVPVTSLIALLSVAGLAISLALQNTLSNLAGGIMLLVTKPFLVGNYVEADGVSGTVSAIGLSYTTFLTIDNKEIFVPNSQLAATKIINYTASGRRRVELTFSASYDAPTKTVKQAIQEVIDSVPQVLDDPAPAIWLSAYQSSSIQYVARVWTTTENYWDVYFAIQEGVRDSFERHGVEMTYDHLNIHVIEKQ